MKSSVIFKICFQSLVLFFYSCTTEVDVLLPSLEKKVVVNSILQPDSAIKISLSESYEIYNDSLIRLDHADVELYIDQVHSESMLSIGGGKYQSFTYPTANRDYKIQATLNGQIVSAAQTMPNKPIIEKIEHIDRAGIDSDGFQFKKVIVTLKDSTLTEDFYEVRLGLLSSKGKIKELYPFSDDDLVLINEGLPYYYSSAYPFSDELFNGSDREIVFSYTTPKRYENDSVYEQYPDYKLIVEVRKTSRAYYFFRRSYLIQQHAKYPDFWDGLGNPVSLYSNIEGGLGIFAAYNSILDTISKPL